MLPSQLARAESKGAELARWSALILPKGGTACSGRLKYSFLASLPSPFCVSISVRQREACNCRSNVRSLLDESRRSL